jgi:hypothetical protein
LATAKNGSLGPFLLLPRKDDSIGYGMGLLRELFLFLFRTLDNEGKLHTGFTVYTNQLRLPFRTQRAPGMYFYLSGDAYIIEWF